jgi:hypothetical protein
VGRRCQPGVAEAQVLVRLNSPEPAHGSFFEQRASSVHHKKEANAPFLLG